MMTNTPLKKKILFSLLISGGLVWLILGLLSNRLETDISTMLRDDAVAVLGLAVEVRHVEVHLASGRAEITGLKVSNPSGFSSQYIFDMEHVRMDIGVLSLLPAVLGWRPYRIEEILIQSPIVSVDIDDNGRSNLDEVLKMIRQSKVVAMEAEQKNQEAVVQNDASQIAASGNESKQDADKHQLARLSVNQLSIEGLTFNINRAGKAQNSGTLQAINMRDIGGRQGTTAAGLGLIVSTRLATDILSAVLINRAMGRLNGSAENLLKKLEKKLQE
jgi:hypothetical protein